MEVGGWRGAKEAVTQWVIYRREKRPERVNRSKQQVETLAMPAAPTEIADRMLERITTVYCGEIVCYGVHVII